MSGIRIIRARIGAIPDEKDLIDGLCLINVRGTFLFLDAWWKGVARFIGSVGCSGIVVYNAALAQNLLRFILRTI